MRIPQAIFTSLRGERLEGYQLAGRSEEISEELARELTAWGPAHDSLLSERADEPSVNFHVLADGRYCLSLTTCAGTEYSGRTGGRVYTQMFVLPAEALLRFNSNPFLVLRAIEASGRAAVQDQISPRLRSFSLVGRATEADNQSPESQDSLSAMAAAVLKHECVAVDAKLPVRLIFAGLMPLLPPAERLRLSFSTGLRYCSRRPFRLFALPSDPTEQRQLQRQTGAVVVDINVEQVSQLAAGKLSLAS